jgi:cell division protein FtsW
LASGWPQSSVKNIRLTKQKKVWDRTLLILTLTLSVLGIIAVADASAPQALSVFNDKFYFVKQQLIWGGFGLALLFIVSQIHYSIWEKIALPLFFISILGLLAVIIPSIGTQTLGARRWLILGSISVQPSEFVKLSLAIYLAKVYSKNKGLIAYFLPLVVVLGLIMLQPDLGTALVVGGMAMTQIFVSGINLFYFLGALAMGVLASLILIITSPYRKERLLTFLSVTQDPLGKSYHIRQVLLALGSGGLFGVGLGASRQKYLFLPEAATDSVFAVIAEEVGFIGALVVLLLLGIFILKAFKIAKNAPDKFSQLLGIGIVSWIGIQIFLNIGSMVALTPLTGVPLPFFSYGGSALTMVLVASGILLNISKHGKS